MKIDYTKWIDEGYENLNYKECLERVRNLMGPVENYLKLSERIPLIEKNSPLKNIFYEEAQKAYENLETILQLLEKDSFLLP